MKEITLTNGLKTQVDDEDFERFGQLKWSAYGSARNYAARGGPHPGMSVYLHREILGNPEGMVVDHIDRNPLNNQRSNLRVASKSDDLRNREKFERGAALKPYDKTQDRYVATPRLREVIKQQGRRKNWLAEQITVDPSYVSHVIAERRTVAEHDAQVWAEILGEPFSALWKLVRTSKVLSESEEKVGAA